MAVVFVGMWAVQFAGWRPITKKAKRPRTNRKRFPARAGTQLVTFFQTVQIAGKKRRVVDIEPLRRERKPKIKKTFGRVPAIAQGKELLDFDLGAGRFDL
ncbi:MAG: hypothetical protein ACOYM3_31140, partial [Terrimicrobiaceae bacterium]